MRDLDTLKNMLRNAGISFREGFSKEGIRILIKTPFDSFEGLPKSVVSLAFTEDGALVSAEATSV